MRKIVLTVIFALFLFMFSSCSKYEDALGVVSILQAFKTLRDANNSQNANKADSEIAYAIKTSEEFNESVRKYYVANPNYKEKIIKDNGEVDTNVLIFLLEELQFTFIRNSFNRLELRSTKIYTPPEIPEWIHERPQYDQPIQMTRGQTLQRRQPLNLTENAETSETEPQMILEDEDAQLQIVIDEEETQQ